ncbi:glycosyltransferase family 4 protein [Fusobacterium animalis]|uniref:glycosyltransferase family 4 protein n=1 Tax=Fusobacterium animalis TaxID=76859 RepID=UPI0030D3971F
MDKKNIWLINQYSYPPRKSGWRRHFDLFRYFNKDKYNIDIISGSFLHNSENQHILKKNEKERIIEAEGIKYHILRVMSYSKHIDRIIAMIQFFFKVIFFSKKLLKSSKPDIIIASSPHPFNGLAGMYLARKYKCPFMLEIRDLWPETWVAMGAITRKSVLYKVFAYIEKKLYKNADKIITLTANKDYYTLIGIDEKKVEIISNGVDLESYDSNLREYKSPLTFSKDSFNILYTGSHAQGDALDVVIETARILSNEKIIFHLVGEGVIKEELKKRVGENNIKNVKFYDVVKKYEIPSLLKESDAVIMLLRDIPLYKYGMSPNKMYEYLASSKPIIFSGNVVNDMVKEANAGISVEAENTEKIKEAVLSLYNMSKEEREILGKNGRIYVEENYDTKILSKKIEKIILNLLEDKNV